MQKGDTLATISAKFHVPKKVILHANDLPAGHHMRPGHYLMIPGVSTKRDRTHGGEVPSGHTAYSVRNGDFDWAIAKRYGISEHKLHEMNPGVHWAALQIGLKIRVPGSSHEQRVASTSGSAPRHTHVHTVAEGENDWIIAHRAGVRLPVLKALNPNLNLASLHPGQKIRVPGATGSLALHVPRIHSSHVAINGDNVTIRRRPNSDSEAITTVDVGLRAAVLDRDGNWYELRFPKGTVGWVRGDLLRAARTTFVASSSRRRHHAYVAFTHHSSHSHYVSYRHRRHHNPGEHLSSSEMMAMDKDAGDSEVVLKKAQSLLGVRYRWGGMSRSGMDCSSLVLQAYRADGIRLPRTSREQSRVGQKVAYSEMKPGDMVFFHTGRSTRVTHAAIYMGHGKFIHASSGGGHVQINSLAEGYYRNRFSVARRIKAHKASHKSAPKKVEAPKPSAEKPTSAEKPADVAK
ncbi:MAG TPA: NlpC/P60 family protein [Fimbriimonas sp.]|nr:NlpC/P60 family protein [Fimbriimonas sp.]